MAHCAKCGADYEGKRCKECVKAYSAAYYLANKDRLRCAMANWYSENKDAVSKQAKAYRERTAVERKIVSAKYRAKNKEKIKATQAEYRKQNRKRVNDVSRQWHIAHPERTKEYSRNFHARNPEKTRINVQNRRAHKRKNGGRLSYGIVKKLFTLQKGKCACCGNPLGDNFHLDHILPIALGGKHEDSNIQLLRQKCNHQKSKKHPIDFMQSRGFLL